MTTITLTPELEEAVAEQARKRATTSEEIILDTLREKFRPAVEPLGERSSLDEWERLLRAAAVHADVSLTDGQVSRETIYGDHASSAPAAAPPVQEVSSGTEARPRNAWEALVLGFGFDAGVSLTDEQVSREAIYEDHD